MANTPLLSWWLSCKDAGTRYLLYNKKVTFCLVVSKSQSFVVRCAELYQIRRAVSTMQSCIKTQSFVVQGCLNLFFVPLFSSIEVIELVALMQSCWHQVPADIACT